MFCVPGDQPGAADGGPLFSSILRITFVYAAGMAAQLTGKEMQPSLGC